MLLRGSLFVGTQIEVAPVDPHSSCSMVHRVCSRRLTLYIIFLDIL